MHARKHQARPSRVIFSFNFFFFKEEEENSVSVRTLQVLFVPAQALWAVIRKTRPYAV